MEKPEMVGPGGYIPQVTGVEVTGDHSVRLTFDDGLVRDVDLSDLIGLGPMTEPLQDPAYFARVFVDPDMGTIAWPNGLDLDPSVLHGDFEPDHVDVSRD
jgi:uncharacterized protein DUF2442